MYTSAHVLSEDRRHRLIQMLDLRPAHRAWLEAEFARLPAGACYRGLVMHGMQARVRNHFGDAAGDDFDSFWHALDVAPPWSLVPVETFIVANLQQASYHVPDMHPREALLSTLSVIIHEFVHTNPLMQACYLACDDDALTFVQMQVQNIKRWQNFGEVVCEMISPDRLSVHYDDRPVGILAPAVRALYTGGAMLFLRPMRIRFEARGPNAFSMHLHLLQ